MEFDKITSNLLLGVPQILKSLETLILVNGKKKFSEGSRKPKLERRNGFLPERRASWMVPTKNTKHIKYP